MELLVIQFKHELGALVEASRLPDDVELLDLASLSNGGACLLLRGSKLSALNKRMQTRQKKTFAASFFSEELSQNILDVFYSLHKPENSPCLIFCEAANIPETFRLLKEALSLGANVIEVKNQRSFLVNQIVLGTKHTDFKKTFSILKNKFKKIKFVDAEKPNASLLRFFTVLKPD